MESSTNSPMGSHHWFHTLIGNILRIGEFLREHGYPSDVEIVKSWGSTIESSSRELILGFSSISELSTQNKYEQVNHCENAGQLKAVVISLADTKGVIQGRRRSFKAARMAEFVEGVIAGVLPPECLTREFGIRQQALYIKYYEDNAKENKS